MPWRRLAWVEETMAHGCLAQYHCVFIYCRAPTVQHCRQARGLQKCVAAFEAAYFAENEENHIFWAGLHCTRTAGLSPEGQDPEKKTSSGADPMAERSTGLARGRNLVCHAACCSHAGMPVLSRPATMVGPYRWRATRPEKVDTLFGGGGSHGATVTSIALLKRRYSSRSAIRSCHPRPQQGSGVGRFVYD